MHTNQTTSWLWSLTILCMLSACNSSPTQNSGINTRKSADDSTYSICFSSFARSDTVLLNALQYGDSIQGSLGYKLYEKDQNNGSIMGKMYGDTLRALYTFMSEGVQSIREIAFLKKDSLLIEGTGNLKEERGRVLFEDISKVKFDGIVLVESPCK